MINDEMTLGGLVFNRPPTGPGAWVAIDRLLGWDDLPQARVPSTARIVGDGDFRTPRNIYRDVRVIELNGHIVGSNRSEVLALRDELAAMHRTTVPFAVTDSGRTLRAPEVVIEKVSLPEERREDHLAVTIFLSTRDPRRYGEPRDYFLQSYGVEGCFEYDVMYPITYSNAELTQNTAVLENAGTSEAYPIVTVTGTFPDGFRLVSGDRAVVFNGPVFSGTPVVVDFEAQAVTQSGSARTRALGRRDFWSIPAKGSTSITFMPNSSGSGWASVRVTDTYM